MFPCLYYCGDPIPFLTVTLLGTFPEGHSPVGDDPAMRRSGPRQCRD